MHPRLRRYWSDHKLTNRYRPRDGYQACFGLGSGLGKTQPLITAQTVLSLDDVSVGTGTTIFAQTLGGALFISAGQNIISNELVRGLCNAVPQLIIWSCSLPALQS